MFIPRSLSSSTPSTSARTQLPHYPQPTPPARETAADGRPPEDPAILCVLAFSDYELWSHPSLRDPNRDGFVPFRTVLHTSPIFLAANAASSFTEAAIVKSLRAHARDTFDIRMIVVDKTRSRRGHHGYAPAGGYEVRRKDWAGATQRFPTFTTEYWDARTIYIENIPPSFRSIVGISKLLHGLLPKDPPPLSPGDYRSIQSIYFPPHHQDTPDTQPKCKGFALLTLSEPSAISNLLARFPYDHHHKPAVNKDSAATSASAVPDDHNDSASPEELEARKAGFRTLSKERWEALQAEYVEYRDALLHRIAMSSFSSSTAPPPATLNPSVPPDDTPEPVVHTGKVRARANHDQTLTNGPPQYESQSRRATIGAAQSPPLPSPSPRYIYPPGCVIFVRHVPLDTNKTALRARFSSLLVDDHNAAGAAALDYVDYTKGLDSCHLRLATREHATLLLKRFERWRAREDDEKEEVITLELLDGRREEMYWECVPDKVRALAVQRSQALETRQGQGDDDDDDAMRVDDDDENGSRETGVRKRRKRRR